MVMGITGSPLAFNPWDMGQNNSPDHGQFYNRLVRLNRQLKPQPELATSWEFKNGGKTLVLKLRKGVKFHSGREFIDVSNENP